MSAFNARRSFNVLTMLLCDLIVKSDQFDVVICYMNVNVNVNSKSIDEQEICHQNGNFVAFS